MMKTIPVKPRRQGKCCALDAARRNSKKLAKKLSKKLQTQELRSAYFSEPSLDFVFT
jgi:hypothetical protein